MNRMTQVDVRGAVLEWAIKDSLVSYVRAMKDGIIAVQLPAEEIADGFRFPAAPHGFLDGSLRFAGCVRLSGHSGMLRLQFEDPWLVPGDSPADPWSLTIIDPYEPGTRMVFARIAQVSVGAVSSGSEVDGGSGGDDSEGKGVNASANANANANEAHHGPDAGAKEPADSETSAGSITLSARGTTLTEDGADLFLSGPYEPGTEFDNPRVVALG